MHKSDLVAAVEKYGLAKADAGKAVEAVLTAIRKSPTATTGLPRGRRPVRPAGGAPLLPLRLSRGWIDMPDTRVCHSLSRARARRPFRRRCP